MKLLFLKLALAKLLFRYKIVCRYTCVYGNCFDVRTLEFVSFELNHKLLAKINCLVLVFFISIYWVKLWLKEKW